MEALWCLTNLKWELWLKIDQVSPMLKSISRCVGVSIMNVIWWMVGGFWWPWTSEAHSLFFPTQSVQQTTKTRATTHWFPTPPPTTTTTTMQQFPQYQHQYPQLAQPQPHGDAILGGVVSGGPMFASVDFVLTNQQILADAATMTWKDGMFYFYWMLIWWWTRYLYVSETTTTTITTTSATIIRTLPLHSYRKTMEDYALRKMVAVTDGLWVEVHLYRYSCNEGWHHEWVQPCHSSWVSIFSCEWYLWWVRSNWIELSMEPSLIWKLNLHSFDLKSEIFHVIKMPIGDMTLFGHKSLDLSSFITIGILSCKIDAQILTEFTDEALCHFLWSSIIDCQWVTSIHYLPFHQSFNLNLKYKEAPAS